MSTEFRNELFSKIKESIYNNYDDNYDYYRFGNVNRERLTGTKKLKHTVKKYLAKGGFYLNSNLHKEFKIAAQFIEQFNFLYDHLADNYSKQLLIMLAAYRVLGHRKVKLPLSNKKYWKDIEGIKLLKTDDSIDINFLHFEKLDLFDLSPIGKDIKLYFSEPGIYVDFVQKQYEWKMNGREIKVELSDVVIDCGGCWGDTALLFADEAGAKGRVFVFEFIPSNISILNKNLDLNTHLTDRITLVPNPVWSKSDIKTYYKSNGPGSVVSFEVIEGYDGYVQTLSIDDLVSRDQIERVDFIKMDIEGAELNALKGAENTIKKYKPKLAIAIYHSVEDFNDIPRYIDSLGLGYKFHLKHNTIHIEETILFASL